MHTKNTAHVGVRFLPRRRHRLWPGTAPSREKANVIREALVTHAIPQNSWPTVEIRITAFAADVVSAVSKIVSAGKADLRIVGSCRGGRPTSADRKSTRLKS